MSATVSYLGPAGTFTEAALWKFAETGVFRTTDITPLPATNPREAIDAVRDGAADFACVAIENSVDGPVTPTFDAIAAGSGVHIYAELDLPIAFAMMLKPGTELSQIHRVATHPVAYQQVKTWLAETIGEHEFIPASSNAAAAQLVADGGADLAAAPTRSADLFGLDIVAENIADVAGARTRFVVVGSSGLPPKPTGVDRTAVVFTLRNEPGSLVAALTEFAVRGVDLSRIESRPIETGLGTYRFHVDLNGHIADPLVAEALRALYTHCDSIRFLGSWPVAQANDRELELNQHRKRLAEADAWVKAAALGQESEAE
ncbi:MAG: prephenate dehydratase [Corynebacterium sp.]|uniref:prephenate dehydratase n=1 Tax=Corynebacterium sp. TaxID=1720 RepID=UPI0026DD388C|nr:prephenate dehydratase [Corynebacterium sp.]MDO5099384.1 prephenate dehydratase [Corynebacterium sp.]